MDKSAIEPRLPDPTLWTHITSGIAAFFAERLIGRPKVGAVTITFDGLTARCTMFIGLPFASFSSWAKWRPSAAPMMKSTATSMGRNRFARRAAWRMDARSSPGRCAVAMS